MQSRRHSRRRLAFGTIIRAHRGLLAIAYRRPDRAASAREGPPRLPSRALFDIRESLARSFKDRLAAGHVLPAMDDHIAIGTIELDGATTAPCGVSRDQRRAGDREAIDDDVVAIGAVEKRVL